VAWYAKTHGRPIDLAAGVYELVQIVRPMIRNGNESYRVESNVYVTEHDLLARLNRDADTARGLGRKFNVVVQVPEGGLPQNRLVALVDTILQEVHPGAGERAEFSLVVSPESDEFVSFSVALRHLRRLLQASPRVRSQ
jgi:hypothetical protein